MALTAHHRTLFLLKMAPLAVGVKGLRQAGDAALGTQVVAVGAALIGRVLIFDLFPVLVNVVALGAVVDAGLLVVRVVPEKRRRPLGFSKGLVSTTTISSCENTGAKAHRETAAARSAKTHRFIDPPPLHPAGFSMTW
jgi:hypothetical protein